MMLDLLFLDNFSTFLDYVMIFLTCLLSDFNFFFLVLVFRILKIGGFLFL